MQYESHAWEFFQETENYKMWHMCHTLHVMQYAWSMDWMVKEGEMRLEKWFGVEYGGSSVPD